MPQRRKFAAYHSASVGCTRVNAVHFTLKLFQRRHSLRNQRNGEGGLIAQTRPCNKVVIARLHIDHHRVAVGGQSIACLSFLVYQLAVVIKSIKSNTAYFARESIGILHVIVIFEFYSIFYRAIYIIFIEYAVARHNGTSQCHGHHQAKRELSGECFYCFHAFIVLMEC